MRPLLLKALISKARIVNAAHMTVPGSVYCGNPSAWFLLHTCGCSMIPARLLQAQQHSDDMHTNLIRTYAIWLLHPSIQMSEVGGPRTDLNLAVLAILQQC